MSTTPDKIEGSRSEGDFRVAFEAVRLPGTRHWQVKIVDHTGDISHEIIDGDALWETLGFLTGASLAHSRGLARAA